VTLVATVLEMVFNETLCARQVTGDANWDDVIREIDKALVMIRSGVPAEVSFHLLRTGHPSARTTG